MNDATTPNAKRLTSNARASGAISAAGDFFGLLLFLWKGLRPTRARSCLLCSDKPVLHYAGAVASPRDKSFLRCRHEGRVWLMNVGSWCVSVPLRAPASERAFKTGRCRSSA